MEPTAPPARPDNVSARHQVAMHLQRIEGNPLDAADLALLATFEAEGWSFERRRAFINAQASPAAAAE